MKHLYRFYSLEKASGFADYDDKNNNEMKN